MESAPSPAPVSSTGGHRLSRVLTFLAVTVLAAAQIIFISIGWRAALDTYCELYPHPFWLEGSFVRNLGVPFGLLCVVYPWYFGLFSFDSRPLKRIG